MNTRILHPITSATNKSLLLVTVFSAILLFLTGFRNPAAAQPATATWVLTANSGVTVTGNIAATPLSPGSGLNNTTYNVNNGATASSFNGAICVPNANDYWEFTITPQCENILTVTSISFDHRASSAVTARCFQLRYSVNGGPEIQIGNDIPVTTTTPSPYSSGPISLEVPMAQVISLRLYGATGGASTSLSVKNFTVTGSTAFSAGPLPEVSISANPSGPICPGSQVTFTASPQNGGTSPTYQWQLNGIAVGSNSSVYSTTALNDGDQVNCIMTSNLLCASPASVTSNTLTTTFLPTTLPTPGAITGPTLVNLHIPGLNYSTTAVTNATSYSWIVPPGWIITGGAGTTDITVTSGDVGEDGNISVSAVNECVTSSPSSLFVGIIPPHNNCNECHITHSSPGMILSSVAGNANLCMSCHNTNGSASAHPFSNSMKATPGVGGNSHNWDVAAVNPFLETNTPANAEMAFRLPDGKIICSTCHNQHNPYVYPSYLRTSNTGDASCKDCHSARNVGTYAGNNANKGSHPVGVVFDPSDPRFHPSPTGPFNYLESKVECSSCHSPHYAASTDGNLLKAENNNAVCTSCHIEKSPSMTLDHEGMTCKTCHYTHSADKSNILMVRNTIETPNSGPQSVVFTGTGDPGFYADGNGPFNGVCEVCHTLTDHYSNTSGGIADARHNPATQSCISCHPHDRGFYAVSNCLDCHNAVTDKPGVGPAGGRRQIVDNTSNGFGTGGDFKRYSHHVSSLVPTTDDCLTCHFMGDHMNGTVKLLDPDQGFLNVISYDPVNPAGIESFCVNCHDANGANGNLTPFSDNITVPVVDPSMWGNSAHKSALTCISCHNNGHGSNKNAMLAPYDYSGPGTGTDLMNEEEAFCLECHGASGTATVKVHLAFSNYNNTTTDFYKHDPAAQYRVHQTGENGGSAFGEANRHVECVDCHNPHGVRSGTATAPDLLPTLTGVTGVEPVYAGAGAPAGFTWMPSVTAEYQVCFKCHSSYTTLPVYLPGGWDGSALIPDGLRKLTTGGTNGQIADSRDMASEYNPNNQSYHPVVAEGKNPNINASTFKNGWGSTSRMYCSSCHNNPRYATSGQGRGPHGSQNLHILDQATPGAGVNYKTYHGASAASSSDVCGKCHNSGSYWTSSSNSRFPYHGKHVDEENAECYLCHDSHGSEQWHLINFSRNVPNCITAVNPDSQNAFAHAVGATNSCAMTCHGTSHSAVSRTYTPAYP
ncbi:MAG: cytochrome c3 family protein [Bacteroidales bacterium]